MARYLTISQIYKQAAQLVDSRDLITVKGIVKVHRAGNAGKIQFISLYDGTTIKKLQAVYEGVLDKLDYMASVCVVGTLIKSPAEKQDWELSVQNIQLVGECPHDYPLPRKQLTLGHLRQYPHLRMRTDTMASVFRIRHRMWKAIMDFFDSQEFISVHTPIITGSDCEGAGETFRVDGGKDFFPSQAYLTVSGQLEGEMCATALGRIFTYGPTFRAEHSDTARHLSEFWMVEPEMAWFDLDDTIKLAQDLISYCVQICKQECVDELKFLKHTLPDDMQFKRLTYTDALQIIKDHKDQFDSIPAWGEDLGTPHERFLTDQYFKTPVVVTHYPKDMKAFYMHQEDDGKTVACFDLLMPGIGEIIGGSQREVRYDRLESQMKNRGMDLTRYQKYLDLRKYGSMPHSGFGMGFERLVRYVTGMEHIRDVIPFPVYFKHL